MVTGKDVMELVDRKGRVSISILCQEFGWTEQKANDVLVLFQQKKQLMLMETAFVTRPVDGAPAKFEKKAPVEWYGPQIAAVRELLEKNPGTALTVNDVVEVTDFGRPAVRNAFRSLVDIGELDERISQWGGAYGKHPSIFGATKEAIDAREKLFERKTAGSKKEKTAGVTVPPTEQEIFVDFRNQVMANMKAGRNIPPSIVDQLDNWGFTKEAKKLRAYLASRP